MAGMRFGRVVLVLTGLGAGLSTGCSTMSNTATGAGIGGALGAGLGTAVGAATGNPRTGAVAGGLIGAGVGGAVGASEDAKEKEQARVIHAQAAANQAAAAAQMSLTDVVNMANCQPPVGDAVIISQINSTGSTFHLSPEQITWLRQNGVSDQVVTAMINARPRVAIARPGTVVVEEPAPTTVIYERPYWRPYYYYPPPPPVGFGVVIRR
jgi:hypothetical protein